jgi:hypothetical protein
VSANGTVIIKGAVFDYERSVLQINRATRAHPSAAAARAVTTLHMKPFYIDIAKRQSTGAGDGGEGVSVSIPDGDRGGADGK